SDRDPDQDREGGGGGGTDRPAFREHTKRNLGLDKRQTTDTGKNTRWNRMVTGTKKCLQLPQNLHFSGFRLQQHEPYASESAWHV
ncbi:hypothetical protein ACJX0J_024311, partial [Zea mays]